MIQAAWVSADEQGSHGASDKEAMVRSIHTVCQDRTGPVGPHGLSAITHTQSTKDASVHTQKVQRAPVCSIKTQVYREREKENKVSECKASKAIEGE